MQKQCHICQSNKIIPDVLIGAEKRLVAVVDTKPHANLFKGRVWSQLRAWICGECGHVELYANNIGALYSAYMKKQNKLSQE